MLTSRSRVESLSGQKAPRFQITPECIEHRKRGKFNLGLVLVFRQSPANFAKWLWRGSKVPLHGGRKLHPKTRIASRRSSSCGAGNPYVTETGSLCVERNEDEYSGLSKKEARQTAGPDIQCSTFRNGAALMQAVSREIFGRKAKHKPLIREDELTCRLWRQPLQQA